jgi:hypothetical protein
MCSLLTILSPLDVIHGQDLRKTPIIFVDVVTDEPQPLEHALVAQVLDPS